MNLIFKIYNLIFYQPISKALFFFYKFFKDFGLAVIFLTFLIRILLFPLDWMNAKEQKKFMKIKKEIEKMKKLKNEEILALYKKEKINPFFSLFSLFIQLPILYTLYKVFLKPPNQIDTSFLGILNLSNPNFFLVAIAIVFQILYFKFSSLKTKKETISQTKIGLFFIPFTFLILSKLPSVISLYFIVIYLFLMFEKILFNV